MKISTVLQWLVVTFILLMSSASRADDTMQAEIQHLLNFVAASGCQYERNGDFHSPLDAKKHIEKKFNYYRDKINSAEDFVRLSATKSSMSGKAYFIHCKGQKKVRSSKWLLAELRRFRQFSSAE